MSDPTPTAGALPGEYLSFRLGAEEYGIPILTVQEIRGYSEPTRIANAPPAMKGVVNLRGVIVPIMDLRLHFRLERAEYNDITATIVLNIGQRVMGIVVDSVSDVIALTAEQIKPAPHLEAGGHADHVTGMATLEENGATRLLILTDIETLMSNSQAGLLEPAHA